MIKSDVKEQRRGRASTLLNLVNQLGGNVPRPRIDRSPVAEVAVRHPQGKHHCPFGEAEPVPIEATGEHPVLAGGDGIDDVCHVDRILVRLTTWRESLATRCSGTRPDVWPRRRYGGRAGHRGPSDTSDPTPSQRNRSAELTSVFAGTARAGRQSRDDRSFASTAAARPVELLAQSVGYPPHQPLAAPVWRRAGRSVIFDLRTLGDTMNRKPVRVRVAAVADPTGPFPVGVHS